MATTVKTSSVQMAGRRRLVELFEKPILEPRSNWWECWQTFNPGAVVVGDTIHLLYRAMGVDGVSRLGYASTRSGFYVDERLDYPVYEHWVTMPPTGYHGSGGGLGGAEDPRVTRVEDRIYVTYTAFNGYPRVGLTSISVRDFVEKRWRWSPPQVISPPGEVHKNWVIFPEKLEGKYAILHSISPRILIEYLDTLELEGRFIRSYYDGEPTGVWRGGWEERVKGAGAPPIKTGAGWLLFYHAIPRGCPECYAIGALILDPKDPSNILYKSSQPVISPSDVPGGFRGVKPSIVYSNGALVKDGMLYIYYGVDDTVTYVAYANLREFLEGLIREKEITLRRATVKTSGKRADAR